MTGKIFCSALGSCVMDCSSSYRERYFFCCSFLDEGKLYPRRRESALIHLSILCALCDSVAKIIGMPRRSFGERRKFKASQGHSRLFMAIKAYSRDFGGKLFYFLRRGLAVSACVRGPGRPPISTQYRLMSPNEGFFPEKKIVYFMNRSTQLRSTSLPLLRE